MYTSYGVLTWLPDLDKWAEIIVAYLKPGGTFYIVEFHPFTHMLDDQWQAFSENYFYSKAPIKTEEQGSYADRELAVNGEAFEWPHTLSEVMGALFKANLVVDSFEEFPYTPCNCFPGFVESKAGEYTIKGQKITTPLVFSIKATYVPELKLIKELTQHNNKNNFLK